MSQSLSSNVISPQLRKPLLPQQERVSSSDGFGCRASTVTLRCEAVERVILTARERLDEPLTLQTLAEIAMLSPYHFNRVFRQITGIPPCQFLTALRMEAAKRLLLTTQLNVTDVCFGVGFNSLGTFTTHFTQFVGLSPSRLRHMAHNITPTCLLSLRNRNPAPSHGITPAHGLTGQVSAPDIFAGLIFVGLFPTPIPQGQPTSCAIMTGPGTYHIAPVVDSCYYVFATTFAWSEDPLAYLLPDDTSLLVGVSQDRLLVRSGRTSSYVDVKLRPLQLTDPPILVALPFLLAQHLASDGTAPATRPRAMEPSTRMPVNGQPDLIEETRPAHSRHAINLQLL